MKSGLTDGWILSNDTLKKYAVNSSYKPIDFSKSENIFLEIVFGNILYLPK